MLLGIGRLARAVVDLNKLKLAEFPVLEALLHLPQLLAETVVVTDKDLFFTPFHPMEELLGLIKIVTERFFYQNIFAGENRLLRKLYVGVMRHDDNDHIRVDLERLVDIGKAHAVGQIPLFLRLAEGLFRFYAQSGKLGIRIFVDKIYPALAPIAVA